ncbi:MAG: helix-turn-helix transcriptional regulator [Lachnospiraceae bacterium]|nr:helix-turn-helix transcriptional regulator [Lachnospiraceae bacterium]
MTISDRIFYIMDKRHLSLTDFSRLTGISYDTICNWRYTKTDPAAESIMTICKVLNVYPEYILDETDLNAIPEISYENIQEIQLVYFFRMLSSRKKRLFSYYLKLLKYC